MNKLNDLKDSLRIAKLDEKYHQRQMQYAQDQIKIYENAIKDFKEAPKK